MEDKRGCLQEVNKIHVFKKQAGCKEALLKKGETARKG